MNDFSVTDEILIDFPVGHRIGNEKPVATKNRSLRKLAALALAVLYFILGAVIIAGGLYVAGAAVLGLYAWYHALIQWPVWTTIITCVSAGTIAYLYKLELNNGQE